MATIILITLMIITQSLGFGTQKTIDLPQLQTIAPQGSLTISTGEVIIGKGVNLVLYLEAPPGTEMVVQSISIGDKTTWSLIDVPQLPLTIRGSLAVSLSAVALQTGKSQPSVLVRYTSGGVTGDLLLKSEWVQVRSNGDANGIVLNWDSIITFLAGAFSSIITTIIITIAGERYKLSLQALKNRDSVHALLKILCTQARYASKSEEKMDLQYINDLYVTEGYYTVLMEKEINGEVDNLWEICKSFNHRVDENERLKANNELKLEAIRMQKQSASDLNLSATRLSEKLICFKNRRSPFGEWWSVFMGKHRG